MNHPFLMIASAILFSSSLFAQAPAAVVSDPGAYAHLVNNVKASLESANALKKQTEILTATKDALMKVSDAIRQFQIIDNIIKNQSYVMSQARISYARYEKSGLFNPNELSYVLTSYTNVMTQSAENLKLANQILKDNGLKMNDAERLKMLMEMDAKSNASKNKLISIDGRYDRAMQKKMVIKTYGN